MVSAFHTLHDIVLHSKNITYLIMGGILIVMPLFWKFLTGREEKRDNL